VTARRDDRGSLPLAMLLTIIGVGLSGLVAATVNAQLTAARSTAQRADAVDAEVQRRHGDDPRWAEAQEQSGRVGRLIGSGALRPWLVSAVAS
jgi:hypothetical protein